MYPHCRLHPTAQISRLGRIRPRCRPSTIQSGGVDSHRDEGARPAPRGIQKRDHHLHQRPGNWELSTPMLFPLSNGAASPPVPRAIHGRLNYYTHGASPPSQRRNQRDGSRLPGWCFEDVAGGDSENVHQENARGRILDLTAISH